MSDTWRVMGECPMGCGPHLFLGDGGYVTCSWEDCPDPGAASDMLARASRWRALKAAQALALALLEAKE